MCIYVYDIYIYIGIHTYIHLYIYIYIHVSLSLFFKELRLGAPSRGFPGSPWCNCYHCHAGARARMAPLKGVTGSGVETSTQDLRTLVPKAIPLMVFGAKGLKYWVLGHWVRAYATGAYPDYQGLVGTIRAYKVDYSGPRRPYWGAQAPLVRLIGNIGIKGWNSGGNGAVAALASSKQPRDSQTRAQNDAGLKQAEEGCGYDATLATG